MTETDLSYQRSQRDVMWDFIIAGGPGQGRRLHYDIASLRALIEAHWPVDSWAYWDHPDLAVKQHAFELRHAHDNHLALPVPYEREIVVEGCAYDDATKMIVFEIATARFVLGFLRAFQARFPENTDLVTIVHDLTYARFDAALSDDDALDKMLSDDDDLMQELGAI